MVLVALLMGLGAGVGFLVTIPQTPTYQARASLEIQESNEDFLRMRELSPNGEPNPNFPEVAMQTQVKVLQSQSLSERVLDELNLEARPLLRAEGTRFPAWAPFAAARATSTARERLVASLGHDLKVRAQPNTRIIEIRYDSVDPVFAAEFVNRLTSEFVEQSLESRWSATQHTGEWLAHQMRDFRTKLESAQRDLQNYANAAGLQVTSDKENVAEGKLRQLQTELSAAQADRISKQSRYELSASAFVDGVPEVLDDATVRDYQVTLTQLRSQSAELSQALTPANPRMVKLQAQIATLESAVERQRRNVMRRISNEYDASKRREALLKEDYERQAQLISQQTAHMARYDLLKREADTTRQIYESMFQRVREAAVASALKASNIRVIDPARVPKSPYKPNRALNVAIGLFGGLITSLLIGIVRDGADRRIRAPGDIKCLLGIPELGPIPLCRQNLASQLWRNIKPSEGQPKGSPYSPLFLLAPGETIERPTGRIEMLTREEKLSLTAECYRNVLTSILLAGNDGNRPRVLVLTSAAPGDGKTVVTTNLAIALAEAGLRVLVVDGDIRESRLHQIFEVENADGLSDWLSSSTSPQTFGQRTRTHNLYVLPSGSKCDPDVIHSGSLPELFRRARSEYDIVLVDTAPVLLIPDARVLARQADAVILIVRAGHSTRDAAMLASQRLAEDGARILGTILNGWNPRSSSQYDYGKHYQHYGSHAKG
jgi:capsular exopolysaccharide synthesis family protein